MIKKISILSIFYLQFFYINVYSQNGQEVNRIFTDKELVKINTVSGNCDIKIGTTNEIKVHLLYTYSNDCFEYKIEEAGNTLKINEDFDGNCSGKSEWTITIPENTNLSFNSASGNLTIEGTKCKIKANTASGDLKFRNAKGEFKINTASGYVEIRNSSGNIDINVASGNIKGDNLSGKIKLNAASGDIEIENSKATFSLSCASGDVIASGIEIEDKSSFYCASGDVYVRLVKATVYDLYVSSASGDAVLDYNGNPLKGYFEFEARVGKGKIISPVKFEKEEVITKNSQKYNKKSFNKESDTPKIKITTASGKAELRK